jgi:hypothetical protein
MFAAGWPGTVPPKNEPIELRSNEPGGFGYLPFQFGVRLLRKASMPSRKSSLI